jgi:hypothetical protein
MAHVRLFLSAVSKEFLSYREALRKLLQRHDVTVQIQEDFVAGALPTLDKLDLYIAKQPMSATPPSRLLSRCTSVG